MKEGIPVVAFRTNTNIFLALTYLALIFNFTAQTHSTVCYRIRLCYLIDKTTLNSFFSDSLSWNKVFKNLQQQNLGSAFSV